MLISIYRLHSQYLPARINQGGERYRKLISRLINKHLPYDPHTSAALTPAKLQGFLQQMHEYHKRQRGIIYHLYDPQFGSTALNSLTFPSVCKTIYVFLPPKTSHLIIISPTYHLLTIRPQQERMLKLRRVRALLIHQRRVRLHDALRDEVVEPEEVLVLPQAVEVAAAEGERAEGLVDYFEQVLGGGEAQVDVWRIGGFGVVRALELGVVSLMSVVER